MDASEISACDDVDVLWKALLAAKADGDHARQRAIEGRMRDLREGRRFAHLSDEELHAQIVALDGQRGIKDTIRHNPGATGGGSGWGGGDIITTNAKIRDNQHVGLERTLAALRDERDRRNAT